MMRCGGTLWARNRNGHYLFVTADELEDLGLVALDLEGAAEGADGFVVGGGVLLLGEDPLIQEADAHAVEGGVVVGVAVEGFAEGGDGVVVAAEVKVGDTEALG